MDKCYKLIAVLLVFINVLIPTKIVQADDTNLNLDNIRPISIKSVKQNKKEVINITNDDLLLLSKLVTGEARGESYEGQVAVGAVILNRVKDSRFPNTISGVIYQPGAFTAVADGQINAPIDESSTVHKAARDAMNGWDPTSGCVYYFNPATATNKWIWSRPLVKTIGKHRFCK